MRYCRKCHGSGFIKDPKKITCHVCPACKYGDVLIKERDEQMDILCMERYGKTWNQMVQESKTR